MAEGWHLELQPGREESTLGWCKSFEISKPIPRDTAPPPSDKATPHIPFQTLPPAGKQLVCKPMEVILIQAIKL